MRDPRAYLVRIVTRQALNRLRTLARRREDYVGEWLPEPLLTSPDVAEDVELAESVSIAMLTVLETLGADRARGLRAARGVRRAVRRDRRGRRQVAQRRCGRSRTARASTWPRAARGWRSSRAEQQQVVERFLAALTTGDLQGLMDVLAPDVVLVADGGGAGAAAIRRPIAGEERWRAACPASAASRRARRSPRQLAQRRAARCGSTPAASSTRAISLTVEDGRITRIYAIRNPHKLTGLDRVAVLTR